MKTITLINIAAEAISVCTTLCSIIIGRAKDDPEVDRTACELSGSHYLAMSESMTVVRELLKEIPEKLRSEELDQRRSDFYVHLFAENDLYDLNKLHSACHQMHSIIYKILNYGRDALELYS